MEGVWAALMVDRCRRHTGFDQLDSPTVHDLVVRRGDNGHCPAEVMGDAETHATDSAPVPYLWNAFVHRPGVAKLLPTFDGWFFWQAPGISTPLL